MARAQTRIGDYLLEDLVSSSGRSQVYRARDARLGRAVALKVVPPEYAGDALNRERLNRELTLAAALDHPNVVPIYDVGEVDGSLYSAARWVEGVDLAELVRRRHPVPLEDAVEIVEQVAHALQAAHAAGLIHRDVKPENVLVARDGHVYLTDFGLARRVDDMVGLTAASDLARAIDHLAPEQIAGDAVDARADVYALGCLLFAVLTGEAPYPDEATAVKLLSHMSGRPPSLRERRRDVPPALDRLVQTALARDPDERPPTTASFARSARAAITAPPSPADDHPAVSPDLSWDGDDAVVSDLSSDGHAASAPVRDDGEGYTLYRTDAAKHGGRWRRGLHVLGLLVIALVLLGAAALLYRALRDQRGGAAPRTAATTRPARAGSAAVALGGTVWLGSPRDTGLIGVETAGPGAAPHRLPIGIGATRLATGGGRLVAAGGGQLVTVDPARPAAASHVRLADPPAGLATHDGHTTWVAPAGRSLLVRVTDGRAFTVPTPAPAAGLAIGVRALWAVLPTAGEVLRLDAATGAARGAPIAVGGRPVAVAATRRWIWIADGARGQVLRLDAATGRPAGRPIAVGGDPVAIAADDREAWVAERPEGRVTRISAASGRVTGTVSAGSNPVALALTRSDLWVSGASGTLTRIPRG